MEVRTLQKLLAPISRRVRLMVGRAVITLVDDALKLQEVQVKLLADEVRGAVERFQSYGHTSVPLPGAEGVFLSVGGSRDHGIVIAVDDRRHRPKGLQPGESALYDDQGVRIHLKRGKHVHVYGADRLTADVAVQADLNCPVVNVSGHLNVGGNLAVAGALAMTGAAGSGNITTPGNVSDGTRSMAADRAIYNGHTHNDPQGGAVDVPNQPM